jgi:hypothetical protein
MPYKIIKLKDGYYKVIRKKDGHVIAHHSTKKNMEAQLRLLNYLEYTKKGGVNNNDLIKNILDDIDKDFNPDEILGGPPRIYNDLHKKDEGGPSRRPDEGGPSRRPDEGGPSRRPDEGGPSRRPDEGGPSRRPDEGEHIELAPVKPIKFRVYYGDQIPRKYVMFDSKEYHNLVRKGIIVPQENNLINIKKDLEIIKKPINCKIIEKFIKVDINGQFKNPKGRSTLLDSKTPYAKKVLRDLKLEGYTIEFYDPHADSKLSKIKTPNCINKETFLMFEDIKDVERDDLLEMPSGYCYSISELIEWIKSQGNNFSNINPYPAGTSNTLFKKEDLVLPSLNKSKELVDLLNIYFKQKEAKTLSEIDVLYRELDLLYAIANAGRICYFDNSTNSTIHDSSVFAYSIAALSELAESINKKEIRTKNIFLNLKIQVRTLGKILDDADKGASCIHGVGRDLIFIFLAYFSAIVRKYPDVTYDPLKTGLYFIEEKGKMTMLNSETRFTINPLDVYYTQFEEPLKNAKPMKMTKEYIRKNGLSKLYKKDCPNDPDLSSYNSVDEWNEIEEWRKFKTEDGYCFDLLYLIVLITNQLNTKSGYNPLPKYPFNPFTFQKFSQNDFLKLKRQIMNNYLIVASPLLKFLFNPEIVWVCSDENEWREKLIELYEKDMRYKREFNGKPSIIRDADNISIVDNFAESIDGLWVNETRETTVLSTEEKLIIDCINNPEKLYDVQPNSLLIRQFNNLQIYKIPKEYYFKNNIQQAPGNSMMHEYNDLKDI